MVWFGETHTHGEYKDTKTSVDREMKLSPSTQKLLLALRPDPVDPDALVFPAPEGGPMNERNFAKRGWKRILEMCKIENRMPYNTRHTFISHCLAAGMNPVEVAQMTGHNLRTMLEKYAGLIKSTPEAPDLFN